MYTYKLINPYIQGNFDNNFDGEDHYDAASQIWKYLSKYFTNYVPFFVFTIEDTQTGELYNLAAKEILNDNGYIDYKIIDLDNQFTPQQQKKFKIYVTKMNQQTPNKMYGGCVGDFYSSDCNCGLNHTALFRANPVYLNCPICYWWYNPLVYRLDRIYIPNFVPSLSPHVQLEFTDYFIF